MGIEQFKTEAFIQGEGYGKTLANKYTGYDRRLFLAMDGGLLGQPYAKTPVPASEWWEGFKKGAQF